jgi:hypothetical protein
VLDLFRAYVDTSEKDGWLMAIPYVSSYDRANRVPRERLGPLVRKLSKNGNLTIEEMADYAASMPSVESDFLTRVWTRSVCPSYVFPTPLYSADQKVIWSLLRFYGSLGPDQLREMRSPSGLSLGRLSDEQRATVASLVYRGESTLQYQPNGPSDLAEQQYKIWYGIAHEPTVCLPEGIPKDGTVRLSNTDQSVVFLKDPRQGPALMGYGGMTANDLALELFSRERPGLTSSVQPELPKTAFDLLQVGVRREIEITFQLRPAISHLTGLRSAAADGSPPVTFGGLPPAFRKLFESTLQDLRRQYPLGQPANPPNKGSPPPG